MWRQFWLGTLESLYWHPAYVQALIISPYRNLELLAACGHTIPLSVSILKKTWEITLVAAYVYLLALSYDRQMINTWQFWNQPARVLWEPNSLSPPHQGFSGWFHLDVWVVMKIGRLSRTLLTDLSVRWKYDTAVPSSWRPEAWEIIRKRQADIPSLSTIGRSLCHFVSTLDRYTFSLWLVTFAVSEQQRHCGSNA